MKQEARQQQLARVLAPRLLPGEEIAAAGPAWFGSVAPDARRLFVGRRYRLVALTDQRLLVVARGARPHHGATPLLDDRLGAMRVTGARSAGLLFQVLVRTRDDRTRVFEFRPRHRSVGRAIADALRPAGVRAGATGAGAPAAGEHPPDSSVAPPA